jgi:hypothetical protein
MKIKIKRPKRVDIHMVGSLIQQNFGENIKGHGFGVWKVDTGEYFFEDLTNDSPFLKFRITDITDIEDGKEVLLNLG